MKLGEVRQLAHTGDFTRARPEEVMDEHWHNCELDRETAQK